MKKSNLFILCFIALYLMSFTSVNTNELYFLMTDKNNVLDYTSQKSPMPTEKVLYYVKPERGVTGRTFLSSSPYGDIVDCWHEDDGSGRQQWVFTKLYSDVYHIEVYAPGGNRKYLSCCGDGSCVDLWHEDDNSGRQKWRLIPLANGSFHIVSVGAKGRTLLSSCGDGSCVDLWHIDNKSGAQRWTLIPEDIEIDKITFDINKGLKTIQPDFITTTIVNNGTDTLQSMTAKFGKKAIETSSFDHQHGFSFSVTGTKNFGVPNLVSGSISMKATTTHNWTIGKSESKEDSREYKFPVRVPKKSTVTAKATVKMIKLDVPYTIIGYSKRTGQKITSTGIWKGINASEVTYSLVQKK